MTQDQISTIIDELCELEPTLENRREELETMISHIMATKPHAKLDERFRERLYHQLMAAAESQQPLSTSWWNRLRHNSWSIMPQVAGGFAMGVALAIITFQINPLNSQPAEPTSSADEGAELAALSELPESELSRVISSTSERSRLPGYTYNYSGNPISTASFGSLREYEPIPQPPPTPVTPEITEQAKEVIDLNRLPGLRMKSTELVQETDDGYEVYLDFSDGRINISRKSLPEEDVPVETPPQLNNEQLVNIADSFLERFGINTQKYGEPIVEQPPTPQSSLPVIYPLLLDDLPVFDQSGNAIGLTVTVNTLDQSVSHLHGITQLQLEAQDSELVEDVETILEHARQGGTLSSLFGEGSVEEKIALELGEPEPGYFTHYSYNEQSGQNKVRYTPALIFPVREDSAPAGITSPNRRIVVPLDQDVLQEMAASR